MEPRYYINPHTQNTERIYPRQGRADYFRYDANENTEGLPKAFVDSVLKEITPELLAMYPEPDVFLKKYADFLGVQSENVYATNGSDYGIRILLETFGEPGKDVVTVSPTFEIYWVCCSLLGLRHVPVTYNEDLGFDFDKLMNAITMETRVVVLLNPNSPIGTLFSEEEVRRAIIRAREVGAIVIIDEAYHYFYDKTFLHLIQEYDNVVLLRTFSKLMALAGCRLGAIISNPRIISLVKQSRLTYEVNTVALLFGERILDHPEILREMITREKEGKAYLVEKLKDNGYWYKECPGNYVLLKTKNDAHIIADRLRNENRVLVHPYGNPFLKDMIRVTTGSVKYMELFMNALLAIDKN